MAALQTHTANEVPFVMRTRLIAFLVSLVLISVISVAGCGGGAVNGLPPSSSDPSSTPQSATLVVTPASTSVYEGASVQFHAQVLGQKDQTVTWSLQDKFGTIDATGLYTAPHDGYGGPEKVVAISQANRNSQGAAFVTVLPVEVNVSPATITVPPGGTQAFTASVVGLDNTAVTWSVHESAGGSITNDGVYSAPSALGFYDVVATSVADPTRNGGSIVTVTTSSAKFTPTGDMQTARGRHTETLLTNGKVLMAGGTTRASDKLCVEGITSAELYDPSTKSFTKTGSLSALRYAHTATALLDGKVLVAGGFGYGFDCSDLGEAPQTSAELYNPSTGTFQTTSSMVAARSAHTATLLPNGNVLITGGGDGGGATLPFFGSSSATAELYDPMTAAFSTTGGMAAGRFGHTATLLANGKVLVVGGFASYSSEPTAAAEIYDPTTGHFSSAGKMMTPRAGHRATRLVDGRILITGGFNTALINGELGITATAELYNPDTGSFSLTGPMALTRKEHTATLLPNGTVLVAGGGSPTAEIYDPSTGLFRPTSSMETERTGHSATLLPDGTVLVAGGGSFAPVASAELYQ